MGIDYFDIYNRFCSDNNTFQGGFVRPERDFERMFNTVSEDIWNEWTAMAEKTQQIDDELAPFAKAVQVMVKHTNNNYGLLEYPKDYGRYSAARVLFHGDACFCDTSVDTYEEGVCTREGRAETADEKKAREEKYKDGIVERSFYKVESSKWSAALTHRNKCPTVENPALSQYDGGFKIAPRQVSVVMLDYYVRPEYYKFAFSVAPGNPQTGAGDYLIYNKAASSKILWNTTMIPVFLERLGKMYAKYTRDGNLFQMQAAGV